MIKSGTLLVIAVLALAWKVFQLCRAPQDRALRVVVAFLAFLTGALLIQVIGVHDPSGSLDSALPPGGTRFALNVLSVTFVYLLICFFIFTSDDSGGRRARREFVLLLGVIAVLAATMLATPAQERDHSYFGAMHPSSIPLFYLAASSYIVHGTVMGTFLAWRYAARTDPRTALGLRIASIGLLGCLISAVGQIASVAARWTNTITPPRIYERVLLDILVISFALFLLGVTYPGLVTRLASARRWLHHRRRWIRMRTLWSVLHEAFPHDALDRPPPHSARTGFRHMHHRAYRRVIECRDGLVRLSPYLAARCGENLSTLNGADILGALRDHAAGRPVPTTAVLVAHPKTADLDGDVAELVRLSTELERHLKENPSQE
jgi:hypothetical protein